MCFRISASKSALLGPRVQASLIAFNKLMNRALQLRPSKAGRAAVAAQAVFAKLNFKVKGVHVKRETAVIL